MSTWRDNDYLKNPLIVSIPLRGRCNVNGFNGTSIHTRRGMFPSPCGEDVMSTQRGLSVLPAHGTISVSIPLRGRCNVNYRTGGNETGCIHQVSIPLRGRCNVNF